LRGHTYFVKLTMITISLMSMSGEATQLPPMEQNAFVRDLAVAVREELQVPIATQNLLWEGDLITDPSVKLVDIFGAVETAEVMVVRRPLTHEEKVELYVEVVRAVAGGSVPSTKELLKEGAHVEPPVESPEEQADKPKKKFKVMDSDEERDTIDSGEEGEEPTESLDTQKRKLDTFQEDMHKTSGESQTIPTKLPCGSITPLMMALAVGNDELVQLMRDSGAAEPDMKPTTNSLAEALGRMSNNEDFAEIVRHLAAGADVNTELRRGEGIRATGRGRPLHACCALKSHEGAYETAQLLITLGADMSLGDQEGDTPLAHAKYFGATEIFALYERNGAMVGGPFYRMFGRT
jgi:hypothetical protein